MTFAENLRAKRESLGLTAEELANRIHVSRSYITLLESGKRFPGKMLLLKIARALRLDKKVVITWYLNCHGRKLKELFGVKRE